MKIAVILPSLAPYGPVTVARDVIDFCVEQGHQVTVFYFDDRPFPLQFPCPTQRIRFFESMDWQQYDLVHSHQFRPDLYVWLRRKRIRVPKVSTVHQDIWNDFSRSMPAYKARFYTWLWKRVLRGFDRCVFVSQTILKSNAISVSSECIYNGRSPEQTSDGIHPEDQLLFQRWREKKLRIAGCIASLIPLKRIDALIALVSAQPDWALMILGEGSEKEALQKQIHKLGLSDRVVLCGFRAPAYPYLSQWDLLLLASESEGLCLSLIEALAMQTPCLCTHTPANEELFGRVPVAYFNDDFLVTLRDSINLKFEHNQKQMPDLIERYHKLFTKDHMGQSYLGMYLKLIDHQ